MTDDLRSRCIEGHAFVAIVELLRRGAVEQEYCGKARVLLTLAGPMNGAPG
ncbi:MAG: hypothetical protein MJE77_26285 [Proteobacteria bacterium]|nr:hypothetical protein [Pseudomonadota bacterium]